MGSGGDGVDSRENRPPSQAVVEAIAALEGISPAELRPPEYQALHGVVDPEALDALFAERPGGVSRPGGSVTFTYCGYEVTVHGCGTVTIEGEVER